MRSTYNTGVPVRRAAVLALAILFASAAARGQSTYAMIRGYVLDPQSAAVPEAEVTVTNLESGQDRKRPSSETGYFEFGYLRPGRYSVEVEAAGFQRYRAPDLTLHANETVRVDARLVLGERNETVTVSWDGAGVDSDSGRLASVQPQRALLNTPLNERGAADGFIFQHLTLVPGAQPTQNFWQIQFLGTRPSTNNFTVDGISANSQGYAAPIGPANPSMDFVQEVKADYSGNSAEFAHPAQVTVLTRPGGQDLARGSVLVLQLRRP